ncbi:MAG: hypothetical protein AB8C84_02145 [Oligoflexales bacterium]
MTNFKIFTFCFLAMSAQIVVSQDYCIAVRGNADRALAHYGALGRAIENFGVPSQMAGSSSASLAMLVVESAMINPATHHCYGRRCTEEERRMRVAFLVKSVPWLMEDFWDSQAGFHAKQAQAYAVKHKHSSNVWGQFQMFRHVREIFRSPLFKGVLNAEWFKVKHFWHHPQRHIRELFRGLEKLDDFEIWDQSVFVRPGLIHWGKVLQNLSSYMDFIAGYDMDESQKLKAQEAISFCAENSFGRHWYELSQKRLDEEHTCRDLWANLWEDWNQKSCPNHHSRLDDKVGDFLPSYVGVGFLPGYKQVRNFKKSFHRFKRGKPYLFDARFENLQVGYWGEESRLQKIMRNPMGFDDPKTKRFYSLGQSSWREAAVRSMSEPGLAQAMPLGRRGLTIGGWAEMEPVQVLRNAGCEKVLFLTREGAESPGAIAIAGVLGMTDTEKKDWFSLNQNSVMTKALELSDAVWCANWEKEYEYPKELYEDAWSSPIFFNGLLQPKDSRLISSEKPICGCVPFYKPS